MSARTQQLAHDFVYGKKARDGSDYRQVWVTSNRPGGFTGRQMWYEENLIYSYETKLAHINRDDKYIVMYEDTRENSNTSREHYDSLLEAIPYDYTIYYRRSGMATHNIIYKLDEIDDLLRLQAKARVRDYRDEIVLIIDKLYNYLHFIKYDKRKSEYRDIAKRLELINLNKNELKDKIAESTRVYEQRQAKKRRQYNLANLERRQTELSNFLEENTTKYDPDFIGVRLKIKDGFLYTDNHIKVLEKEARLLYKRYTQGKTIIGLKLDGYTVLQANKDRVVIGCTTISSEELKRVLG